MTKRITPEIVIKSQVILSCFDCPFYEERGHDDGADYYCRHPDGDCGWVNMAEAGWFHTETGTGIWVGCPLPKVDTVSEEES